MITCIWMRTLINNWIYFINIASLLAAITDPLLCNIVSLVATNWFTTKQQIAALTLITICSTLGPIGGSFYSLVYIDPTMEDVEQARSMMFKAVFYIAITYTCMYIPCALLFRGKPPMPPW